ncbi:3645_t:CDS:10, partial [Funneliformis mosseae]
MEPYIGNEAVLKYFETYDEETWTYEYFLNELKETIITSPPYTNDWSGLDVILFGIVRSRGFAVVFGTQVMITFDVVRSGSCVVDETNKPRMESFFQNIILEREKRNAGKNYVIEGVRILNETRFRSSDKVIFAVNKRYPKDQASGASHKRQCLQTENGPSQTLEDKVAEVTDDKEWEFDTPQPSWLKKLIEERCLLISKDDPITTYKSSLRSIWWKIIDLSDPKIVNLLSESELSDLNAMFSSALKDWTVLEPSAEKCLKSLSKLDSYQLRTIGETVRPKGTHGAILRLQEMISTKNPIILEDDDLFYDGYIDEDIKIFSEEISLLDHNNHLDPDVAYIFDLIRYTCEMIAKGIPSRQNSERDIDVFIKRHIFLCFDDILDSGEVVSRASRDRRANAVDAPSNAEGYHLDWMFTRHDLGKDLIISAEGDGMLSKPVLQSITKLLMPSFLSSYFVLRAILVIYVEGGYYASINLADFDIPTKYEELKSVIKISHILLQIKKLLSTTITQFKLIKQRAEKKKLAPGRMIVPVREKEHRSPQKPK